MEKNKHTMKGMARMRNAAAVFWLAALLCGSGLQAQQAVRPRVSGLERDSVYMSLLMQERDLKNRQDSLASVIEGLRASFATDTADRAARGARILQLEGELFDTRNTLGIIAGKANGIEQEFILRNIGSTDTVQTVPATENFPATDLANLVDNAFFGHNLSRKEYARLKDAEAARPVLERLAGAFRTNYEKMARVTEGYDSLKSQRLADSVYDAYRKLLSRSRRLEDSLGTIWGRIYGEKSYLYSFLLDKLNRTDLRVSLNEKERGLRAWPETGGVPMSETFAAFPAEQGMMLSYELALADALGLQKAADSLKSEQRRLRIWAEGLAVPRIALLPKEYVTYADVNFPPEPVYGRENPIPELDIPDQGTYYSVTVGTFSSVPSVGTFRGAVPLAYERVAGGARRYYVGLFRTYGDAAEAVQLLKEKGFRRPEPVRWNDGQYENLASLAARNKGLYRVEIEGIPEELPEEARYLIDRFARNKEITRIGGVFSVGVFSVRLHAEELAGALDGLEGVQVKITGLEE